jgi:hypothetical protein
MAGAGRRMAGVDFRSACLYQRELGIHHQRLLAPERQETFADMRGHVIAVPSRFSGERLIRVSGNESIRH